MRRAIANGYEPDDDRDRVDVHAAITLVDSRTQTLHRVGRPCQNHDPASARAPSGLREVLGHVHVGGRGTVDRNLVNPLGVGGDQHPRADVTAKVTCLGVDLTG